MLLVCCLCCGLNNSPVVLLVLTPLARWDAYTLAGTIPPASYVETWESSGSVNITMTGAGNNMKPTLRYEYGVPHVAFSRSRNWLSYLAADRPLTLSSECETVTVVIVARMHIKVDDIMAGGTDEKIFMCGSDYTNDPPYSLYNGFGAGRVTTTNELSLDWYSNSTFPGAGYRTSTTGSPAITGQWQVYVMRYQTTASGGFNVTAYTRAGHNVLALATSDASPLRLPRTFGRCHLGRSLPPQYATQQLSGDIREVSHASTHAMHRSMGLDPLRMHPSIHLIRLQASAVHQCLADFCVMIAHACLHACCCCSSRVAVQALPEADIVSSLACHELFINLIPCKIITCDCEDGAEW